MHPATTENAWSSDILSGYSTTQISMWFPDFWLVLSACSNHTHTHIFFVVVNAHRRRRIFIQFGVHSISARFVYNAPVDYLSVVRTTSVIFRFLFLLRFHLYLSYMRSHRVIYRYRSINRPYYNSEAKLFTSWDDLHLSYPLDPSVQYQTLIARLYYYYYITEFPMISFSSFYFMYFKCNIFFFLILTKSFLDHNHFLNIEYSMYINIYIMVYHIRDDGYNIFFFLKKPVCPEYICSLRYKFMDSLYYSTWDHFHLFFSFLSLTAS